MNDSPLQHCNVFLPGRTLGVLGSGQLGRMFVMAAKHMGYRVHVFSTESDSPAGQVADREFVADYGNLEIVQQFARSVDVITLEFENVPLATIRAAAEITVVHPGEPVLKVTQNRILEKTFLQENQLPVCDFHPVTSLEQLRAACQHCFPAVLKTTTMGYDGKGQVVIHDRDQIETAWANLNTEEAILEELVEFEFEFSVIGARTIDGRFAVYDPIRNDHQNHILDVSQAPAGIERSIAESSQQIVTTFMKRLDAVGVLCVEFFMCRDGRIVVNEIAPRPHNSGHLTLDAHATSQFEQQVRAICGLPLGCTDQLRPAAMVNLLGDAWQAGQPDWQAAMNRHPAKLHLYGKEQPRPGRKMGHMTVLAESAQQAAQHARAIRDLL